MRKLVLLSMLLLVFASHALPQYRRVTIRQIQEVPKDSLLVADILQNNPISRWTLQKSPMVRGVSPYGGDTVTVTALVAVPAKIITYTGIGYTLVLYDTAAAYPWGGIFVRASDTLRAITDGLLNVAAGDIIEMTGYVSEFTTSPLSMNSVTQFVPIPGIPITIKGSGKIPKPVPKTIGDFYYGLFPVGSVRYSTGEPYEGLYVELTNLVVDGRPNIPRGTFTAVDVYGNQIFEYDASKYFTFGHGTILTGPDTTWQRIYPVVGATIDTMRGIIFTVSGQENGRGYRIAPIYRSDLVLGRPLLSVSTHRRNPVVVPPDSSPRVSIRVLKQAGGSGISSVRIWYSYNGGVWGTGGMTYQASDTTYFYGIPRQTAGTNVRYFFLATDSAANPVILANAGSGGISADTSKGYFFYDVLNRPLTIQDVQYTPYLNGRSPYVGAVVTVAGVVTADTSQIGISPLNTAGTTSWYIQSGSQPWNGIWITPTDTAVQRQLKQVVNGDSISVTGTVQENFDVTRLGNVTAVTKLASGRPEPKPIVLTTGAFAPNVGNGSPSAEPYEGMLVRFNNVVVTDTASTYSDATEFYVDDGSGPIIVRRDGRHNYSNVRADTASGKTLLKLRDRISSLTGILYYSFNRYKITPRTNADFGTVTSVELAREPGIVQEYALDQNYPNPFNPSTVIQYQLPSNSRVTLKVYNVLGQEVQDLVNEVQQAGKYTVRFGATSLATGVYFYRLHASPEARQGVEFTQVKKMLLVK